MYGTIEIESMVPFYLTENCAVISLPLYLKIILLPCSVFQRY